jgi:hypothetical protein
MTCEHKRRVDKNGASTKASYRRKSHRNFFKTKLPTKNTISNTLTFNSDLLDSIETTNKMQPCNRIYYSTVHWRLDMFRAAHRSSSRALTVFAASGLHTYVATGRSQVWVGTQTWLRPVTTCVCKPEAENKVRTPNDERCAARNMLSFQWTVE